MLKVFVDGSSGATGVTLQHLLAERPYDVVTVHDSRDKAARYAALNDADIAVLCVPDDVAFETINDNHNTDTVLIDTSTCSRQNPDWVYGYYYDVWTSVADVAHSKRISNPGCFATGIQTLIHPIQSWLTHYPIIVSGISGYSAGGKAAIDRFQNEPVSFKATNINRQHTHVAEVIMRSGLTNDIIFMPAVGSFMEGQLVSVPITQHQLNIPIGEVYRMLQEYYRGMDMVELLDTAPKAIIPARHVDPHKIKIAIAEFADHIVMHAWYSNLTAGAAGSVCRIIDKIAEHRGR